MKLSVLILVLVLAVSGSVTAQSFFKPLPKLQKKYSLSMNATTPAPDSTFTGIRPIVSAAVYGYTKESGSSLFTGAGVSYEHDTYSLSTQKWYTDWSVGALFYAGGTSAPTGITGVTAMGVAVSFFNKLLSVGGAYNFQTKGFMPTIGASISLNN